MVEFYKPATLEAYNNGNKGPWLVRVQIPHLSYYKGFL